MARLFIIILVSFHLMQPVIAHAADVLKTPLSYTPAEYGVVLALAMLGGAANWWAKARSNPTVPISLAALVGELCVSAFTGLIAFYLCEAFGVQPLLTATTVGMAGHAGARALNLIEKAGLVNAEKQLGIVIQNYEASKHETDEGKKS